MDRMDDFIGHAHRLITEASHMNRQQQSYSVTSPAFVSRLLPPPTSPSSVDVAGQRQRSSDDVDLLTTPDNSPRPPELSRASSMGSVPFRPTDSTIKLNVQLTDRLDPALLSRALSNSASLHAILIRDLRPNVMDDFELLFKMLTLDDLADSATRSSNNALLDLASCAPYAVCVLTQTEPQLLSLGPQICDLLSKQPSLQRWAPKLARSLMNRASQDVTHDHQDGRQLGATGPQKKMSHNQVPFRENTDSKHHFKTSDQKRIYDNRERVRDAFLNNLNRVISSQNEISSYYSVDDEELNRSFRLCVQSLMPENLAWFARLFVQHLLNVSGDDREFDKDVKNWAVKRAMAGGSTGAFVQSHTGSAHSQGGGGSSARGSMDRINKLSRRMDGGVMSSSFTGSGVVGGDDTDANTHSFSKPRSHHQSQYQQSQQQQNPYTRQGRVSQQPTNSSFSSTPSAGDWWEDLFPRPAERFFPLFLYVADSHALCVNVQQCCESTLDKLSYNMSGASAGSSKAEDDLSFAERVASCNVLAKFLGFLTHYPRFASTKSALENKDTSVAFDSLHVESVDESNRTGPLGMDPREILARASEKRCLTLVVPWITRYLAAGPGRDYGARESLYVKETLVILSLIRKSRGIKDAMKRRIGFGHFRMIADIDMILQDLCTASDLQSLLDGPVSDAVIGRFPRFLDWLERTDDDDDLALTSSSFDAVPLDRVATCCIPMERLRQLLLSATALSAANVVGKAKLRRVNWETPVKERIVPFTPVAPSLLVTTSSTLVAVPQQTTPTAPTRINPVELCKQSIVATFLHHQEEVARIVEFAALSGPPNILNQTAPFVTQYALDAAGKFTEVDMFNAEAESTVLDCIMTRSFYVTQEFVEQLVDLSLAHKPDQFREAVTDIAVEKVEMAVEKVLKRRIADLFALEKERLEKKKKLQYQKQFGPASARSATPVKVQ